MDDTVTGLLYLAAKRFLHRLKSNLKVEDKHKYEEFQKLVRDSKDQPMGSPLRYEIMKLFGDYPDLEAEFTSFLPAYATEYKYYVKETLKGEEKLFQEFWGLLEQYKAGRMDFRVFRDSVSLLFKDHKELVDALQYFIIVEAAAYGNAVKEHFAARNEDSKYEEFVRLLHEVRTQGGKFSDVRIKFVELFQNDCRVIQGLNRFLPENESLHFIEAKVQQIDHGNTSAEDTGQEASVGDQLMGNREAVVLTEEKYLLQFEQRNESRDAGVLTQEDFLFIDDVQTK